MDSKALAHLLDGSTIARIRHDELLAQIKVPVLLLQGSPALEGLTAEQDVARALALLDQCTHIRCANAGDNIHETASIDFSNTYIAFWNRQE